MIGKQGSFWPALLCLLGCLEPSIKKHVAWKSVSFNQAVLSRTLINPLHLTNLFTLGKGTSKMRAVEFFQEKGNDPLESILSLQSLLKEKEFAMGHQRQSGVNLTPQWSFQAVLSAQSQLLASVPYVSPPIPSPMCCCQWGNWLRGMRP